MNKLPLTMQYDNVDDLFMMKTSI